ncbi:MAG: prepilin-type N-terminal cleavage/methylation domain-containing protein [Phycisphaerales bacterium]|nr:prepilin-type N-terminal cleavage/methylation domain-containing protein [Phycisphaerales bacterium]
MNRPSPLSDVLPSRRSAYSQAFTLIELLVVISIIALLIAILLPALSTARRTATATQCLNKVRSMVMAAQLYGEDYKSVVMTTRVVLPTIPDTNQHWWPSRIMPYIPGSAPALGGAGENAAFTHCPATYQDWDNSPKQRRSQSYGMTRRAGALDANGVAIQGADYPWPRASANLVTPSKWLYIADSVVLNSALRISAGTNSSASDWETYPYPDASTRPGRQVDVDRHEKTAVIGFYDGHAIRSDFVKNDPDMYQASGGAGAHRTSPPQSRLFLETWDPTAR